MRTILTLSLFFIFSNVSAQGGFGRANPFLKTQWYLGFFGGVNLAGTTSTTSFNGYSPINYNANEVEKTYNNFSNIKGQYGLVFMYYTSGFTIGIRPGIHIYGLEHNTSNTWQDSTNPDNTLEVNYTHNTQLNYMEFPLTLQYDLLQERFRPYVGLGAYYGLLLNATRTIERSGTDAASGSSGGFINQEKTIGVKDLYIKSLFGVIGFIGASYDPGNIRITMDIGYKFGLSNITNAENRFLNNEMAAIGEVPDDQTLQNLYLTMAFVFPLKFISKDFNSY
jgi:hypothetical protein